MFRRISSSSIVPVPSEGDISPESDLEIPSEGTSKNSSTKSPHIFSSPKDSKKSLSPEIAGIYLSEKLRKVLPSNKILPGIDSTESQFYDTTPLVGSDIGSRDECFDTDVKSGSRCFTSEVSSRANRQFSTTSTIYANSTISNPDMRSIFLCLSSVIQAQICSDDSLSEEEKIKFPNMDIIPDLPPECGGPMLTMTEDYIRSEANDDPLLYEMISSGKAPTVDTIYRFMSHVYTKLPNNAECSIMALIYINRMASISNLRLTMTNWRAVWLISVILAYKIFDDKPMKLSQIATKLPIFDRRVLVKLELSALKLLDYSTAVQAALYINYYYELRQMFTELNSSGGSTFIPQLNKVRAMQIEAQSSRIEFSTAKHKDRVKNRLQKQKGISKTLEDDITRNTPYVIGTCA